MKHLFLSPHPDDAALSCGGLIYRLAQAGQHVEIFTLMAANLPPGTPQGEFLVEHILRWKLGPDPGPGRRAEDARAAGVLGASITFGDLHDAIYRVEQAGTLLYPDLTALFAAVADDDPARTAVERIARQLPTDVTLYAPLGAGHHIDHQLVRDIGLRWRLLHPGALLLFYEEYPYTVRDPHAIDAARALLSMPVEDEYYPMSETALAAKIASIACYVSQIPTFWSGVEAMAEEVRQYAAAVGSGSFAERYWRPLDVPAGTTPP